MNIHPKKPDADQAVLLHKLQSELSVELQSILAYWRSYVPDPGSDGFHGSVNNQNEPDPTAPRGLVMYARILWAFSRGYGVTANPADLQMAERAYRYIDAHFLDTGYGGYYWSVDSSGLPLETRKQVYGQAFCLYGLAAYYQQVRDPVVLQKARDLFGLLEERAHDRKFRGYIEAFDRQWLPVEDQRLSAKDQNDRKTMNTHLHIIEAYAALYQVWKDELLKSRIEELLNLFGEFFINKRHGHLQLFFNDHWQSRSFLCSFGHDIEASWLLLQCAEIIEEPLLIKRFRNLSLLMLVAGSEGLDKDGGLWYEYDRLEDEWVYEKHSWPQAEAMIAFFSGWQLTDEESYLEQCLGSWGFIKKYLLDRQGGEWYWGVDADHKPMEKEKAGFWKCPYHNTRACLELIERINLS